MPQERHRLREDVYTHTRFQVQTPLDVQGRGWLRGRLGCEGVGCPSCYGIWNHVNVLSFKK